MYEWSAVTPRLAGVRCDSPDELGRVVAPGREQRGHRGPVLAQVAQRGADADAHAHLQQPAPLDDAWDPDDHRHGEPVAAFHREPRADAGGVEAHLRRRRAVDAGGGEQRLLGVERLVQRRRGR